MQNGNLPELAQNPFLEEDPLAPGDGEEPTPTNPFLEEDPATPANPFLEEDPLARPSPVDDVIRPELSDKNWIIASIGAFFTSPNKIESAKENVLDMLKLLRPWGKRASGETTAIPGVADLARLFAETQHAGADYKWYRPASSAWSGIFRGYTELDEQLFGGVEQTGGETPMLSAFADYLTSRYNFSKPEVRAAFEQVVREDPIGVMTDMATVASLGAGGFGAGAKTAALTTKMSSRMSRILGVTQRAADVVNRGFHLPTVPGKLGAPGRALGKLVPSRVSDKGFEIKTGLVDALDPGVWTLRAGGRAARVAGDIASNRASRYPDTPEDVRSRQEALVRQGFSDTETEIPPAEPPSTFREMVGRALVPTPPRGVTDEEIADIYTPLSLMNRSEGLLDIESRRFQDEHQPIVDAVARTEEQVNARLREVVESVHADGDIGNAATALAEQYAVTRQELMNQVDEGFQLLGAEPGLVIDLRPIYTTLQELRAQDMAASRLSRDPGADVPFAEDAQVRNLNTHVEAAAAANQNRLTPEFLAGTEEATPTRPVATASGQSAAQIEDALYGTPTRDTVDLNTGERYATTFRVMELDDIITSHTMEGQRTAGFQEDLQVKDMSSSGSQTKVFGIARNLISSQMLSGLTIQQGTPILNKRSMSISGNHRLNALRVALLRFPEKYAEYRQELKNEMPRYGLTDDVDAMDAPALVRVLDDDVDERAFARAANVSDVAQLSETSQAMQDLHLVDDDMLTLLNAGDGTNDLATTVERADNQDFRNAFINKLADSEKAQFVGEGTQLQRGGLRRMINAIRAKVFSGDYGAAMRRTFTEVPVRGFKNIQRGIDDALPALVTLRTRLGDLADYDIAEPLAEAVMKIRFLMEGEESGAGVQRAINTYLGDEAGGQAHFEGLEAGNEAWRVRELDEKGRSLLRLLAVGVRRPSVIREFLRDYSQAVSKISTDASQPSLLGDTQTMVPPEEYVDTFVNAHLKAHEGDAAMKEGLDEFFQSDAVEAVPDEVPSTETPTVRVDAPEPGRPVLFENIIGYRDALVASLASRRGGPRVREWRAQLLGALDRAILDSLEVAHPERASMPGFIRHALDNVSAGINSTFGQLLVDMTDGSRNLSETSVQRAVANVFTSDDTPASVAMKYELLGGFRSDAAQRVRRIFLGKLFDFVRTDAGHTDARAAARGDAPMSQTSQRFRPEGVSRFLNQFSAESSSYAPETLKAIIGSQAVDDLHDLDIILQSFGRFMQSADRNQSFFDGVGRGYRERMGRIIENFAGNAIRSLVGAGVGSQVGGGLGVGVGAVLGYLGKWLGQQATTRTFDLFYDTDWGRKAMLEGVELSLRGAWDAGARVLWRGKPPEPPTPASRRAAARTARLASKDDDDE